MRLLFSLSILSILIFSLSCSTAIQDPSSLSSPEIQQEELQEKPESIVIPVSSLGDVSETRKQILQNSLEDELKEHFTLISEDRFEKAREKAFEQLEYEECTEDQCIMLIQEMLQVENVFHLQVIAEEPNTQLSLNWMTLNENKKETDLCVDCGTVQLNNKVKILINKLLNLNNTKLNSNKNILLKNSEISNAQKSKLVPSPDDWIEPITGMHFVRIPGKKYRKGKYEVTQGEWEKIIGSNPSTHKISVRHPVDSVSWNMANEFSKRLAKANSENIFRLPTWDEWLNACNSGDFMNAYGTQDGSLNRKLANYGKEKCCEPDDSDGYNFTAPVGSYPPNKLGIHDMSGNLRELTIAPEGKKLYQGGGWSTDPLHQRCRIQQTNPDWPDEHDPNTIKDFVGFRLIREENKQTEEEWIEPLTGMQFVRIPGKTYWMGKYEVTQGEWEKIMGYNQSSFKSSNFTTSKKHPIDSVSWVDAQRFVVRLNKISEKIFRLPSINEWEYVCQGGNFNSYGTNDGGLNRQKANWGNDICCGENAEDGFMKTSPVGSFPPNQFGIYDMSGNVREWIENEDTLKMSVEEKAALRGQMPSGELCLYRGGSFTNTPQAISCNDVDKRKICNKSGFKAQQTGFRLLFISNTVIDTTTGLMWQKKVDGVKRTNYESSWYCENLKLGGYSNWKLPESDQLKWVSKNKSIFDDFKINEQYWSSTEVVEGGSYAWKVFLEDGSMSWTEKNDMLNVRCLRESN